MIRFTAVDGEAMSKLKLAVGVILLLFVGALIGSLATGMLVKQRVERFAHGGPPPEGAGRFLERLAERLDLTEDQRSEISELIDDYNDKIFGIRSQYLPEIKEATDETLSLLREKLDDRQKERLDRLKERVDHLHKRREPHRRMRSDRMAERFLDRLQQKLELSPEQAEKIRPIIAESMERRRAAMERFRGAGRDRSQALRLREEIGAIEAQTLEKLAQFLSEEQLEAYRSTPMRDRPGRRQMMAPRGRMQRHPPGGPDPTR